jgi:hypothetical protein
LARVVASREIYRLMRVDLKEAEAAGFFLADYAPAARSLHLREWRAIRADGFESRSNFHLVLRDDTRAEIIKWAWDSGASLVEVHSHDFGLARFSPSDLDGLEDWVPHLWWRLRGRPYGAIVIDGETIDALAWIDDDHTPEQVIDLTVEGGEVVASTELTLAIDTNRSSRL